jgi:hypothetical protein
MINMLVCTVAFGLAHGRTQRQAEAMPDPTVRLASLVTIEPDCIWLEVLDWIAMTVPPLIPVMTLIIISVYWNQFPSRFHEASSAVADAAFSLAVGLFCTASHWALRFRARGGDWASTPRASHAYRTYLGVMQGSIFTLLICQMCVQNLMPLNGYVSWLHPLKMTVEYRVFMATLVLVGIFALSIRSWISNQPDRQSGDPMPDRCWKWGYFYYNPNDSVLVVPTPSALARIHPGVLAKNDPSSCFRRRGVNILRGHRRTGLARIGARLAVRDGAFWTFPATFPSNEAFYTPSGG